MLCSKEAVIKTFLIKVFLSVELCEVDLHLIKIKV